MFDKLVAKLGYEVRDRGNRKLFDRELRQIFCHIPPRELTIFDVGCYYGESIERFSTLFPGCTKFSFEPDNEPYIKVKHKYQHNDNISIHNFGVGADDGFAKFYRCTVPGNSSFNNILESSNWAKQRARIQGVEPTDLIKSVEEISVRSLGSFTEEQGVNHIDILKLDCEGWENECLRGCESLLYANKVHVIQLELVTTEIREHTITIEEIRELIPNNHFDYFIAKHRQIPFTSSPKLYEVLLENGWLENYDRDTILYTLRL